MAQESLQVSISKLLGKSPYSGPENTSRDCPYFQKSLEQDHGRPAVQEEICRQMGVTLK